MSRPSMTKRVKRKKKETVRESLDRIANKDFWYLDKRELRDDTRFENLDDVGQIKAIICFLEEKFDK